MNSVDPLYAKIADEWMKQLLADFGTDHWCASKPSYHPLFLSSFAWPLTDLAA